MVSFKLSTVSHVESELYQGVTSCTVQDQGTKGTVITVHVYIEVIPHSLTM